MRIAVMQPYFLPYAGYFRLMQDVDAFVVYDSVQFPRGGWVHRNRLLRADSTPDWLTLPLASAGLATRIGEIAFHARAREFWPQRLRRFPACLQPRGDAARLAGEIAELPATPMELLLHTLRATAETLGLTTPFLLASELNLPNPTGRLESLLAICHVLGAREFVNAPGGRRLYHPDSFTSRGITLRFLPEYRGGVTSILQRLHDESAASLRREILDNMA